MQEMEGNNCFALQNNIGNLTVFFFLASQNNIGNCAVPNIVFVMLNNYLLPFLARNNTLKYVFNDSSNITSIQG